MSRLEDAKRILEMLGMPPQQRNDNAAYTLLAFAGVGPRTPWTHAKAVRIGPHGVIEFARKRYEKNYAENTRETIRRQAIHQFVQAGVLIRNPDEPELATNSPRTHYGLSEEVLSVLRAFGTVEFDEALQAFRAVAGRALAERYAKPRRHAKVRVQLAGGEEVVLSPGAHNELQRLIVEEFLPRFAPGATLLYLGDTDHKTKILDRSALGKLGVPVSKHDKLPDIVAHEPEREWLFLIEAVTSHGPVSAKRFEELEEMFEGATCGRVYVSAFPTRREFKRHLDTIAWETEVWIADAPGHMIHYNGDRFLGPR